MHATDEAVPDNMASRRPNAATKDHNVTSNARNAQHGVSGATRIGCKCHEGELACIRCCFNAANASQNRQMQLMHANATQNADRDGGMGVMSDTLLKTEM